MFDEIGTRLKEYESAETSRRLGQSGLPVYARIDGRGFSKFTRGLRRPFDERMSHAMVETTKHLVAHTGALIGYTQSDEISLAWKKDTSNPLCQMFFDGKVQKLVSVLAGLATAKFTSEVLKGDDEFRAYSNRLPHFDCRVFELPSEVETANVFLWRSIDATRNAVTMAAHHLYSPNQLFKKNVGDMLQMIDDKGVKFDDFPSFFRYGTFVRRSLIERILTDEEWEAIPQHHRPERDKLVIRSVVDPIVMPRFIDVANRVEVIFQGDDPVSRVGE